MLFVTLMTRKVGGDSGRKSTRARRVDWTYPEGFEVIGEYWLPTDDPSVVIIAEAEDVGVMFRAMEDWDDVFEFQVFPAIPAEVGIAAARQAMAAVPA